MQEPKTESATVMPRNQGWGWYLLASILILAPVYWQPRVQAGDLSAHIYNAWFAQLIETGQTQGLAVVRQSTNILFDLMLGSLFRVAGAEFAQRISVSLAVLVFVWGAFRFATVVAGRRPWHLLPSILMLAYGWVFHMGFFNFYLSMGLCFWVLSVTWGWAPRGIALAAPLLGLAYMAHALPVVWTVGLLLYQWLASRIGPRWRLYLTASWLLAMVVVQIVVSRVTVSQWSLKQVGMSTGADQVSIFDGKYYIVLVGLLALWAMLFLDLLKSSGHRGVASSVPFQLCVISAAAVVILPTTILLPGFNHTVVYTAERMSLGVGICVCALLATARPRPFERYAMVLLAAVFFGFVYRDEKVLNRLEDRTDGVISVLPPAKRLPKIIDDREPRRSALCVDRRFGCASHVLSTAPFRVRASAGDDYRRMYSGRFVAQERDLPLKLSIPEEDGRTPSAN